MNLAVRHRIQQTLIYLGLAEEADAPAKAERDRDWYTLLFAPILVVLAVGDDRGTALGAVVALLFLPLLMVASRLGPMARVDDRLRPHEDSFFVAPVMFGGALLLFPDSAGVWPPALFAAAISALVLGIAWRRGRRRKRERPTADPTQPSSSTTPMSQ